MSAQHLLRENELTVTISEREVAQRSQEKFEFYLIGLVFTLLALSIQTAVFGQSRVADACELMGWVSLVVSGIAGLWRLEYIPIILEKIAIKDEYDEHIAALRKLKLEGAAEVFVLEAQSNQAIDDRLAQYERGVTVLDPVITKLEKHGFVKYNIHRYTFVAGVALLVFARAYVPMKQLAFGLLQNAT